MPYPSSAHADRPTRVGRRRRKGRRLVWRVLMTAAAFVTVLAVTAGAVAAMAYKKYNGQITRVDVLSTKDPAIRDAPVQQHAANFLVIGSDTRAGADAKFGNVSGARSDTVMLVHISPDRSKATVISIPRDSWVDIPACTGADGSVVPEHSDMFNSAFSIGGPRCTIATVQKLTGIAVTHFVEIDFTGFQRVVDALGAVTICSPKAVTDPGTHLVLHPGDNRLDGRRALKYVRAREALGDGSDLGRIKRQQQFLGVVLRQAMSGSLLGDPVRLTHFLDAATKAVTVDKDTTFDDLRTLASSLRGLDPKRVAFYTAPIADANYAPPGTDYTGKVKLDEVKGRALYQSIIDDRPAPSTSSTGSRGDRPNRTAAQRTCSL